MQASGLISYLQSPSLMALTGHASAQAPQAMQSSEILYAIFKIPPYLFLLLLYHNNSEFQDLNVNFLIFFILFRVFYEKSAS